MVGAPPTLALIEPTRESAVELRLRLLSGAQAGRLIELTARRCTIGSAAHCTLRLKSAGIQPVHCVIDRTREQTTIQSLAGQTWLDGQPLHQAVLNKGARLRVATIEFEVVCDGSLPPLPIELPVEPSTEAELLAAPIAAPVAEVISAPPQRNPDQEALEQRLDQLQGTLDQLGEELEQENHRRDSWHDEFTTLLHAELAQSTPNWASAVADDVTPQVTTRVTADVLTWLEAELAAANERLSNQIAARVCTAVTPEVAASVHADLKRTLTSELSTQVEQQVASATEAIVPRLASEVQQTVAGALRDQLSRDLSEQVSSEVARSNTELVSSVCEQVTHNLSRQLTEQVAREVQTEIGRQACDWRETVARDLTTEVSQRVMDPLAQRVAGEVAASVTADLPQRVGAEIERQSQSWREEIADRLKAEVLNHATSQLAPDLRQQLRGTLQADLTAQLETQMAEQTSRWEEALVVEAVQRVTAEIMPQLHEQMASLVAPGDEPQWATLVADEVAAHTQGLPDQLAREVTDRVRNFLGDQVAAQVARQLAAEQSAFEEQRKAWEAQQHKSQSELGHHAQHLEQRLEALTRFQRGLDEQHQQWQHDLHSLRPEVLSRAEQIEQQVGALRQQHDQWAAERAAATEQSQQLAHRLDELLSQWEVFRQEHQSRLALAESSAVDRSEQVDQRLAEIRAQREAFEHDREHGPVDRSAHHPGEHARAIDDRIAELQATREAMQRERQHHWSTDEQPGEDSAVPEADPQAFEPEQAPAALQTAAELPRRVIAEMPPAEPAFRRELEPDRSSFASGDDDSIENYMARLMDRVRGVQGAPIESRVLTEAAPAAPRRRETVAPVEEALAARNLPMMESLSEIAPRSGPVERPSNLTAMRDLANLTARGAIDAHSRKRMQSVVWGKLIVAFVALVAAAILTWMSGSAGKLAYGAALVSTLVAVLWGVEYLVLSGYRFWRGQRSAALPRASESTPSATPASQSEE